MAQLHRQSPSRERTGQDPLPRSNVKVRRIASGEAYPVDALAKDLAGKIRGEVRFDNGSRALWAADASNYRQVPVGVVLPKDKADIVNTVAASRRLGVPVLPRGGGTSLAGQCCNAAVVIDSSKYMHHVLEIDPEKKIARVEPGVILDELRDAAETHHLTFGPDPATHNHCTLGGMIGNNSCGIHSVMAGRTSDNIEELEILTYDGLRMRVGATSPAELDAILREGGRRADIYRRLKNLADRYGDLIRQRYPDIPRRVSGYNLVDLLPENGFHVARALVGSEGTCVTVLEATTRLVESPPARALVVLGYPDIYEAGDHVLDILGHGVIGLEGIDHELVGDMRKKGMNLGNLSLLPEGKGWLLAEFGGGDKAEAKDKAQKMIDALRKSANAPKMKLYHDENEEKIVWKIRESGLGATARVPGQKDHWPGWEDSAVDPKEVGAYLRELRALFNKYDYNASLYGHLGQACIHCRIDFDLLSAAGIKHYLRFLDEASDLVIRHHGSFSGEHGDGQSRAALLPKMFGPELIQAFREFKSIWDPDWKMNPGKVVDAYPVDANLRLGTGYHPAQPATHFQFPDDKGSFSYATQRCVGVGKCRRMGEGTMCPSYMVTREEKDSTRGRAHALFEMLNGDVLKDGWREESVKDALDLCLACKGCKSDCPVNVDMATYKAEFLSHYYDSRRRPRHAYAFGWINWWARLGQTMPRLVNLAGSSPLTRGIAKKAAGMAPERTIPKFAKVSFREWYRNHQGAPGKGRPVILWADTFNNHFHPDTAIAAVEVLEAAGCRVSIPKKQLCCGRPLYDFGMLDQAKRRLREIMTDLRQEIRAGIPIVGLEPSCTAVFRDELPNLFPNDEDAKRLTSQVFTLGEYLEKFAKDFKMPQLKRKAIVQGHCHHKSVLGFESEEKTMSRLGLEAKVLDSGCCGMAGAFGFEEGHYEVSKAAGERVLLPAVRAADRDALIIADGFSCREQIRQETDRKPIHLAQVIRMALRNERARALERKAPEPVPARPEFRPYHGTAPVFLAALAAGAAGYAAVRSASRR